MSNAVDETIVNIEKILKGKQLPIKLALCCLFAEGHLLIQDLPGMGKTTLASTLAKVSGLAFSRVQFTSDLLPADILGATIYEKATGKFQFQKGAIFTQVLLADEINRTTPKTQSALLEAMAERQVTIEGTSHALPSPFFVIATQNPSTQFGTFTLPESQLDRFLMRIELGYPDSKSERAMLKGETGREQLEKVPVTLSREKLSAIQNAVRHVSVSETLLDYIQRLIQYTRDHPQLQYGISPRGALALLQSAKAWAFIHKREYVIPEDVQAVLPYVFIHRLVNAVASSGEASAIIVSMLREVAVS